MLSSPALLGGMEIPNPVLVGVGGCVGAGVDDEESAKFAGAFVDAAAVGVVGVAVVVAFDSIEFV